MRSVGPEGERQGWQRIKNRQEGFLTMRSVGPEGERQGWQRIKNRLEGFLTASAGPGGERQGWRRIQKGELSSPFRFFYTVKQKLRFLLQSAEFQLCRYFPMGIRYDRSDRRLQ
jgi:hypothetical protein